MVSRSLSSKERSRLLVQEGHKTVGSRCSIRPTQGHLRSVCQLKVTRCNGHLEGIPRPTQVVLVNSAVLGPSQGVLRGDTLRWLLPPGQSLKVVGWSWRGVKNMVVVLGLASSWGGFRKWGRCEKCSVGEEGSTRDV